MSGGNPVLNHRLLPTSILFLCKQSVELCMFESMVSTCSDLVNFECTTSPTKESGAMSLPLGTSDDGELDGNEKDVICCFLKD